MSAGGISAPNNLSFQRRNYLKNFFSATCGKICRKGAGLFQRTLVQTDYDLIEQTLKFGPQIGKICKYLREPWHNMSFTVNMVCVKGIWQCIFDWRIAGSCWSSSGIRCCVFGSWLRFWIVERQRYQLSAILFYN